MAASNDASTPWQCAAQPTGSRALEKQAAATAAAAAQAEAWGDPGRGCYAVVIGARAPRQNPEDALAELATKLTGLGLTGWSSTGADGGGQLARGGVRGGVRASAVAIGPGAAVVAAACFSNAREPVGCAAHCQGVLASFDAATVTP